MAKLRSSLNRQTDFFASTIARAFWMSCIMPSTSRGSVKTLSFGASDFA